MLQLCSIFFPFADNDIQKIRRYNLRKNHNIDWNIEAICKFTRAYDKTYCLHILDNKKIIWDDNLLEEAGLSDIDWVYVQLSSLSNVHWTNSFIIKHREYFDWDDLTLNPHVLWTENLLFEVEEKVKWDLLIGNPNVRWSKKIISRVIKALDEHSVYANNYNFYEKYVALAISSGFRVYSTYNLLDNAIQYLKQFNIHHSTARFYKVIWDSLSENPNIPWTIDDLEQYNQLNIAKLLEYAKGLPFQYNDFLQIKEKYKHTQLLAINIDNNSFWDSTNIQSLIDYCEYKPGKKEYVLGPISRNESIKWNQELFLFIRENHDSYWDDFKELSSRENFFEFLINSYKKEELLSYLYKIYDSIKEYF